MANLKDLQDKRLDLANKIKEFATAEDAKGDTGWSAETTAAWDALNADYDSTKTELDSESERASKAEADKIARENRLQDILNYKPSIINRIGRDGAGFETGPRNQSSFNGGQNEHETMAMAMQGWMLNQVAPSKITDKHHKAAAQYGIGISDREFSIGLTNNWKHVKNQFDISRSSNTLSSQTGGSGGFTFGETFIGNLELAMLAYGGMLQVADVIRTTTSEPMRWPTANDTTNTGRQLGESAAVTTLDPTFAQVIWNAYKFTSDEILVPYELLRDNAVNLLDKISELLGIRLGRIQNKKFTIGSGANTAKGIVTAATTGVTCASSTAIAADELIDLEHSIDPSRRSMPGVGYMFNDGILKSLRKLKDGMGRYLWQAGFNTGAPDMLNNRPYTINQDMQATIATGTTTIVFGQMSQYKVRQVNSIRLYRLVERYRENDQDAFLAFIEADGNLLDAGDHPVKCMVQP